MLAIIKIGTWDKNGMPTGWHLDLDWGHMDADKGDLGVMNIKPNGDVYVGGVLMKEWSDERKKAMGVKVE